MKSNWKKVLAVLLTAILIGGASPAAGWLAVITAAESVGGTCGASGNNLTWSLDTETGVLTISGTGDMANYVYVWYNDPDAPGFASDTPWRAYRTSVQSVIVEDGVTKVGNAAFRAYENLASVTLADSVTTIGEWAFGECGALTNVTLSEGLTTIGAGAFAACTGLHGVTIPEGVTSIGENAFWGAALTSVSLPRSVQEIGTSAFACYTISDSGGEETINPTLTQIGVDPANDFFSSANGILYDKAQTTLLQYPGAAADTDFSVPDGVTTIAASAFYGGANLQTVTIPEGVLTIGDEAFAYCMNLERVHIGSGTETIGKEAFVCCTSLVDVTLPDTVTMIDDSAFENCTALVQITVPDSVITIGEYAFSGCMNLRSAALGSGVETIGKFAFSASGLTTVIIPENVLRIEGSTFADCANLTSIHIPYMLIFISESALADCDNLSFICSDTADCYARTYAAANGIEFRLCTGHDNEAATLSGSCGAEGDNVLWALNLGSGRMVLSGYGDMADYAGSADTPWADYRASIRTVEIQNGVTNVGSHAFAGCVSLQSVTFGEDVTRIGAGAFASSALTSIAIPGSVREIGADAFACGVLTEYGFVPTLQRIEVDPDSMTFFSRNGVLFNRARTVLILYPAAAAGGVYEIPNTVKRVEPGAFKGSLNLMCIHVPNSVTQIGAGAFADCNVLSYLCCDIAGSCVETYAADNAIPFRYCEGHKDTLCAPGDANCDGSIDLKDVILIRRYLAGGWNGVVIYGRFADVDADGAVTLQDVALISRYLAGGWDVVLQ